ncbi:MAG: hypothetical protein HYZ21_02755 [Chloroflexi bacterium]|nr:hypothetical protein [Chloroflexota bacterium]
MNRITRITLLALVLLSAFGIHPPHPVRAATEWVVTSANDSGTGSLRQAIANASDGDTIKFDLSLAGQTIHVASMLVVDKSLTIDGGNLVPSIKINGDTANGNSDLSLMTVAALSSVEITGIEFTNGKNYYPPNSGGITNLGSLRIKDCIFSGNIGDQGGAIRNSGELTVTYSVFNGNTGLMGGGAIFNDINGSTTISNTSFTENPAYESGGAILNLSDSINISNSTFSANSASDDGGAIANLGTLTLTDSILSNNSADYGGGVANSGTLTITKSRLSSNSTYLAGAGGGIMNFETGTITVTDSSITNNSADNGGGLFNFGTANFTNSTIAGNSVSTNGGGVSTWYWLTLTNSTIVGNSAATGGGVFNLGTLTTTNATFSENSAATGGGIYNGMPIPGFPEFAGTLNFSNTIIANSTVGADCYSEGLINTNINNLVENNAASPNQCGTPSLTSDPNLGPLANNGGPTQTMALLPGSPAIGAGGDDACPSADQRGITRPQGVHCDIGAFEYEYEMVTKTLKSIAMQDGWIRESTETSGTGGTMNSTASTLNLGDDAANRQYRAILSFDTSPLPDNAVITKVTLKFKYAGFTGTLPFSTHGNLLVDIRKGPFGGNPALQLGDFKATANKNNALSFTNTKVNNWYTKLLSSINFAYINRTNVTQFRLHFQKDDNHDFGIDLLRIYSGNADAANRPQLIIEYYVP